MYHKIIQTPPPSRMQETGNLPGNDNFLKTGAAGTGHGPYEDFRRELEELKEKGMLRSIPQFAGYGKYIFLQRPDSLPAQAKGRILPEKPLLNLSSNDYLGLLERTGLIREFLETYRDAPLRFSSASSRLLTGNCRICEELEDTLRRMYRKEAALVLGSGYHANAGILGALADKNSLILADKLVHASLIDGIRLSGAPYLRFRHNDLNHLEKLLQKEGGKYKRIFVVTESIFSMDGDATPLEALAGLKDKYPQIFLYVDEAHAFGVKGKNGLGLAEELSGQKYKITGNLSLCQRNGQDNTVSGGQDGKTENTAGPAGPNIPDRIDMLVATFGKALSSAGAFVVCSKILREYLVNKMRPLIFSTALPEINLAWSLFILKKLPGFTREREHLREISDCLQQGIRSLGEGVPQAVFPDGSSQIVPYITGEASKALAASQYLIRHGIYALAVRPPTVPEGTSRLRFSLTAAVTREEIARLLELLRQLPQEISGAKTKNL